MWRACPLRTQSFSSCPVYFSLFSFFFSFSSVTKQIPKNENLSSLCFLKLCSFCDYGLLRNFFTSSTPGHGRCNAWWHDSVVALPLLGLLRGRYHCGVRTRIDRVCTCTDLHSQAWRECTAQNTFLGCSLLCASCRRCTATRGSSSKEHSHHRCCIRARVGRMRMRWGGKRHTACDV